MVRVLWLFVLKDGIILLCIVSIFCNYISFKFNGTSNHFIFVFLVLLEEGKVSVILFFKNWTLKILMEPDEEKQVLFAADTVSLSKHPEWQATQVFHTNEPPQTEDIDQITSVEFSRDGEHIAVGDRGGRIWIYSTNNGRNRCKPKSFATNTLKSDERKIELENIANNDHNNINKSMVDRGLVYDFYGQFQSHQPEFDYLKSLEIEEKINCISWCKCANNSLSLLACNGIYIEYLFHCHQHIFLSQIKLLNYGKCSRNQFTNNLVIHFKRNSMILLQ